MMKPSKGLIIYDLCNPCSNPSNYPQTQIKGETMKTFLIKKTIELHFEFNKENWDISTAETMAKYVDDSEAYHSTVFYSVSEIEEESEDYDEFGVNLKNTFNTEPLRAKP